MMRIFRPCDAEQRMGQIAELTNNPLAHETYKRIKSSLSAICTHPMRKGLIHQNPVTACSVPQGKPFGRTCYAYSLQEIFEHLKLFEGDTRARAIIGTVAFAGLREGELRGLWGTDDSGNYLQIRRSVWRCFVKERGKNVESGCEERPAEVPIINPLRNVLDCVPHGSYGCSPTRSADQST